MSIDWNFVYEKTQPELSLYENKGSELDQRSAIQLAFNTLSREILGKREPVTFSSDDRSRTVTLINGVFREINTALKFIFPEYSIQIQEVEAESVTHTLPARIKTLSSIVQSMRAQNRVLDDQEKVDYINKLLREVFQSKEQVNLKQREQFIFHSLLSVAWNYLGYSSTGKVKNLYDLEDLKNAAGVFALLDLIYCQLKAQVEFVKGIQRSFSKPSEKLSHNKLYDVAKAIDDVRSRLFSLSDGDPNPLESGKLINIDNSLVKIRSMQIGDKAEPVLISSKPTVSGGCKSKFEAIILNSWTHAAYIEENSKSSGEKEANETEWNFYKWYSRKGVRSIPTVYAIEDSKINPSILMENYDIDALTVGEFYTIDYEKTTLKIGLSLCDVLLKLFEDDLLYLDVKPDNILLTLKFQRRENASNIDVKEVLSHFGYEHLEDLKYLNFLKFEDRDFYMIEKVFSVEIDKVALADFGLLAFHVGDEEINTLMGTDTYAPPEKRYLGKASRKSVVYELCATLFTVSSNTMWHGVYKDTSISKRAHFNAVEMDEKSRIEDYLKRKYKRDLLAIHQSMSQLDEILLKGLHPKPELRPTLADLKNMLLNMG